MSKKQDLTTAVIAVNAIVLGVIALHACKPQISKLAKKYTKAKRLPKKSIKRQVETKKVLENSIKEIGNPCELASQILPSFELATLESYDIMPEPLNSYIIEKLGAFSSILNTSITDINFDIKQKEIFVPCYVCPQPALTTSKPIEPLNTEKKKSIFKGLCGMVALIVALNSKEFNNISTLVINDIEKTIDIDNVNEIIDDIDEFFTNAVDSIVTLNNHDKIIKRKIARIENSDATPSEKLTNILEIDELTDKEKVTSILSLSNIDYQTKFDFILANYPLNETIEAIIHSNIASSEEIFNYVMNIKDLTIDEKITYITESSLTSYKELFDYLQTNDKIPNQLAHEHILNSSLATEKEKFQYYVESNLSSYDKIWYILQIPNMNFSTTFNLLINESNLDEADIIEQIMKTDLISFKELFNNILKIEGITENKISSYLVYFNTYYNKDSNTISQTDLIDYMLNIKSFTFTNKVDTFWSLISSLTINEKIDFILNYYNYGYDHYINISTKRNVSLSEEEKIILNLFDRINELKIEYILSNYDFGNIDELNVVIAGCAAEGAKNYLDLYWVANTFFNRITDTKYVKKGTNPYHQFISPHQFAVYYYKDYIKYLNAEGTKYEEKAKLAKQAFLDMFYNAYDGIQHNYLEFRSWDTVDFSNNIVVPGGNRYGGRILSNQRRIKYDNLNGAENFNEEVKILSISK